MIIIAERLNSTRAPIAEAMRRRDTGHLLGEARRQWQAGVDYLDVNAAMLRADEADCLGWLIGEIQAAIPEARVAIDSPDARAMAAGLAAHRGRALLNSVTGERARLEAMLPLIAEHRPRVVALAIDDQGIDRDPERRFAVATRLVEAIAARGIEPGDIFVDPVIVPVSADQQAGTAALDLIARLAAEHPGVHVICGLSNVSFGLPLRRGINRVFLSLAIGRGLDAAILDPLDGALMADLLTAEMLLGRDRRCKRYLAAYRSGALG